MAEFMIITPEKAKKDGTITRAGTTRAYNFGEWLGKNYGDYFKILIPYSDLHPPLLIYGSTAELLKKGGKFTSQISWVQGLWAYNKKTEIWKDSAYKELFSHILEVMPEQLARISVSWIKELMKRKNHVETYILIGESFIIQALFYFLFLSEGETKKAKQLANRTLLPLDGYYLSYADAEIRISTIKERKEVVPMIPVHDLNLEERIRAGLEKHLFNK